MSSESNKQVAGSHTPGPWRYTRFVIYGGNNGEICSGAVKENARRIVACVNALAHVTTEELESGKLQSMVQRAADAEKQRDELATKAADLDLALFAENQKRQDVERQRDELLAALNYIECMLTNLQPHIPQSCKPNKHDFIDNYVDPSIECARAAISSVKGGAE